jgi:hypothetical protein
MGADKNSSPKRELSLCPNSQPRIPTRVCQSCVVTADLPTLGANPKRSQSESKTQRAKYLAAKHWTRRTVREALANCPRPPGGLSARVRRTVCGLRRTVRKMIPDHKYCTIINGLSAMGPRIVRPVTDHPTLKYGPSANSVQQKSTRKMDQTKGTKELTKNTTNCWLKASSWTVRQGCVDRPHGAQTAA